MVKLHKNTKHYCEICDKGYAGSSGLWYHNKNEHNAVTNSRPRNKISKKDSTEEQKKEVKTEKVEKVEKDVQDYNPKNDYPEDDNEPDSIRKDSFYSDDPSFEFHREKNRKEYEEKKMQKEERKWEYEEIGDFPQGYYPNLYWGEMDFFNYLYPDLNDEEIDTIKNTIIINSNHTEISSKEDILDDKKNDKKDDKSTSVKEGKRRREEIKQESNINSNKSKRQKILDRFHKKRKIRIYRYKPIYTTRTALANAKRGKGGRFCKKIES